MRIEGIGSFGWSPFSTIKKAGKLVVKANLYPYKLLYGTKAGWAAQIAVAGTILGVSPAVTGSATAAFLKTGKVPPGTDPKLAAVIKSTPQPGILDQILTWLGIK